MRIEYNEGCTSHGLLEIDGENFFDLPQDRQKEIAITLINNSAHSDDIYEFIRTVCEMNGKEINSGHCDQCGDYYCTYLLKA